MEFSVGIRVFVMGLSQVSIFFLGIISKFEKVPRGIRGEKSSKDMASSRNSVSTIGASASPKMGNYFFCLEYELPLCKSSY